MDAQTDPALASTVLTHRESRLIVFGVLLPTFLGSLDNTVLATALPTIGRDFGNVRDLPWLITAYLIAATAVIPLYGKLADIHGRMFALRLALFLYIGASLVCALAPNMPVLICGRVLHGFGGGGLTSLGMIVLGDVAAPKERGRYYAYFSVVYTSAGACGPACWNAAHRSTARRNSSRRLRLARVRGPWARYMTVPIMARRAVAWR